MTTGACSPCSPSSDTSTGIRTGESRVTPFRRGPPPGSVRVMKSVFAQTHRGGLELALAAVPYGIYEVFRGLASDSHELAPRSAPPTSRSISAPPPRQLIPHGRRTLEMLLNEKPTLERRAAHERLSTGALARWARACATHPWRVIGGWVAIVLLLVALVGAVGGNLRDEFEIPGSDAQKAIDLIETEFASEQGGVLNVVFAAPEGERLDTPERQAAIENAVARLKSTEFKPTEDTAGVVSVADPFSEATFSEDGRIAYAEAQFDQTIEEE